MTTAQLSATPAGAGTDDDNVDGQAVAITVFSAVRWWGRIELPLFFALHPPAHAARSGR